MGTVWTYFKKSLWSVLLIGYIVILVIPVAAYECLQEAYIAVKKVVRDYVRDTEDVWKELWL
jgi:hypothetical protein